MADKPKMARFSGEEGKGIFDTLSKHWAIIAPVKRPAKGRFSDTALVSYEEVKSFDEIDFFNKTQFSAKSVLLPIRQAMISFRDNKPEGSACLPAGRVWQPNSQSHKIEEADDSARPMIIFLRSCDIHAIKVLDAHFLNSGGYVDFYYQRLRQKVKLFLIECEKPFENCFCVSFQTNKTDDWAAFIRKVEGGYEIQARDEELAAYFPPKPEGNACLPARQGGQPNSRSHKAENILGPRFAQQDSCPVKIPQDIDASIFEDDIWKEYTLRCIACGRCTTTCPTCSCFSVQDIICEDKAEGERKRIWSSCLVKKFSLLAGGHDFRVKEGDRLRYRVLHKIYDFRKRQGVNMCIGCGRCDDACPEYISMFKCIEKINQIIDARAVNG